MMDCIRRSYVEFLYPGTLIAEREAEPIALRDPALVEVPEKAFAFRFFDKLTVVVREGAEDIELRSDRINESGMYYLGGEVYSLPELEHIFPEATVLTQQEATVLTQNMRNNNWVQVIKTRLGNWQPFEEGDRLLDQRDLLTWQRKRAAAETPCFRRLGLGRNADDSAAS